MAANAAAAGLQLAITPQDSILSICDGRLLELDGVAPRAMSVTALTAETLVSGYATVAVIQLRGVAVIQLLADKVIEAVAEAVIQLVMSFSMVSCMVNRMVGDLS